MSCCLSDIPRDFLGSVFIVIWLGGTNETSLDTWYPKLHLKCMWGGWLAQSRVWAERGNYSHYFWVLFYLLQYCNLLSLFFFFNVCLKGRITEKQRKRKAFCILWFTPIMATKANIGSSQSQECRAPAGSPIWAAVPKQLGHLLSPSHVHRQGVGSEVEKLGLQSMPFIGCQLSLLCHSTSPTSLL